MSDAQLQWIRHELIEWHINSSGRKCWCEKCGHSFTAKTVENEMKCPNCGSILPVAKNRKRTVRGYDYVQIITTKKRWQVIRYFIVKWDGGIGGKPLFYIQEVLQKWCQPGQRTITRGAGLVVLPYWCNIPYSQYGDMSIKRSDSYFYQEWMKLHIYPRMVFHKAYRLAVERSNKFTYFCADDVIARVYSNPYFELLFRCGKYDELKEVLKHEDSFIKYWPSIRIALRHKFKPENWNDYIDYLRMLSNLHKDMHSPRYVAPKDYDNIHYIILQQFTKKKREEERKRREREEIRMAEEAERQKEREAKAIESFNKRIEHFRSLLISSGGIEIRPLMTIQEFSDEGNAMKHCVFALGYYSKPDSLILSARDHEGRRIETIEVGLRDGVVLQSRGPCNTVTDRHEDIINMVQSNMKEIQMMAVS